MNGIKAKADEIAKIVNIEKHNVKKKNKRESQKLVWLLYFQCALCYFRMEREKKSLSYDVWLRKVALDFEHKYNIVKRKKQKKRVMHCFCWQC